MFYLLDYCSIHVFQMASTPYKQDLPPKGGYAPINYKRIPAKSVLKEMVQHGVMVTVNGAMSMVVSIKIDCSENTLWVP